MIVSSTYRYTFDKDASGVMRLVPVTDVQTSDNSLSVESEEILTPSPTEEQPTEEVQVDSEYQQKIVDLQTQQTYLLLVIAFGVMLLNGFKLARLV